MTTIETDLANPDNVLPFVGKVLRRRKLEVPCQLTHEETRLYGMQLARRKLERDAIEEKRKSVNTTYKGQLAEKDSEIDRLTSAIDTGSELRNMDTYDELIGSQVFTKRADTHEVINQCPASVADTQEDLFPDPDDEDDDSRVDTGDEMDGEATNPGEMVTSSAGDAVFVGGDGEEVVTEEKPKKKRGGNGKGKKK